MAREPLWTDVGSFSLRDVMSRVGDLIEHYAVIAPLLPHPRETVARIRMLRQAAQIYPRDPR